MSGEDKSRKTEDATEHKLRKARQQGSVVRSKEVVSAASLLGTAGFVMLYMGSMGEYVMDLTDAVLGGVDDAPRKAVGDGIEAFIRALLLAVAPVAGVALLVGLAANLAQFGVVIAPQSIKPSLERINPVEGAKRLFNAKQLLSTLKAVIKIVVIATAAVVVVRWHMNDLALIVHCGIDCGLGVGWAILWKSAAALVPVLIVLAWIDYHITFRQHRRDQRMTREELQQEQKETLGNPEVRQERRRRGKEDMNDDLGANIREASFMVSDDQRVLAVRYDPEEQPVPLVTIRQRGAGARRVLVLAEKVGGTIVHDQAALDVLFPVTRQGDPVPRDHFDVVARLILKARENAPG